MRKANLICSALVLLFSFCSIYLFGQTHNAYKFIEPSTAISYDSNMYRLGQRYTAYQSEAYDFHGTDTARKISIHIKSFPVIGNNTGKAQRDKVINQMLLNIKNGVAENDSLTVLSIDKQIREIHGMGFVGMTMQNKQVNKYMTFIFGFYVGPDGMTELNFGYPDKSLEDSYTILTDFLKGFKPYTKKEYAKEEAEILSYKVTVTPVAKKEASYERISYAAVASVNSMLKYKVAQVRIINSFGGAQVYDADKDGKVYISLFDEQKGQVTKKGEFIMLNSAGKQVAIPFTITYNNKGPL